MKTPKIILLLLIAIVVSIAVFYFCSTRSNYTEVQYTKIHHKAVQNLSNADTLTVMTYNIGYLSGMTNNIAVERPVELINANSNKTMTLLNSLDPHIIGFQEIDFESSRTYEINQYHSLLDQCQFSSGAMAVNWDKKYVPFPYWPIKYHFGKMYSGQAVLSKFKILHNERIVLPQPESNPFYYNDFYLDRLAQINWLDFNDTKLLIINVHFEAWDGSTREEQSKIVLDFYRKYADSYPVILMGDFNCTPPFAENGFQESTIQVLLDEQGLEMSMIIEDYKENPQNQYTFDSEDPEVKIDYIFYNSKFFNCIESHVVYEAKNISDHLPVLARLSYKNNFVQN